MRAWDAYTQLEAKVKNMLTSLRAVGELQNPAIRQRHWDQLMQATKVNLVNFNYKTNKCRLELWFTRTKTILNFSLFNPTISIQNFFLIYQNIGFHYHIVLQFFVFLKETFNNCYEAI